MENNENNNVNKTPSTKSTKDFIITIASLGVVGLGWYFFDSLSDMVKGWSERQKLNVREFTNSFFSNLPPSFKTIIIAIIVIAIAYSFRSEFKKVLNWEKSSNMKKETIYHNSCIYFSHRAFYLL